MTGILFPVEKKRFSWSPLLTQAWDTQLALNWLNYLWIVYPTCPPVRCFLFIHVPCLWFFLIYATYPICPIFFNQCSVSFLRSLFNYDSSPHSGSWLVNLHFTSVRLLFISRLSHPDSGNHPNNKRWWYALRSFSPGYTTFCRPSLTLFPLGLLGLGPQTLSQFIKLCF